MEIITTMTNKSKFLNRFSDRYFYLVNMSSAVAHLYDHLLRPTGATDPVWAA